MSEQMSEQMSDQVSDQHGVTEPASGRPAPRTESPSPAPRGGPDGARPGYGFLVRPKWIAFHLLVFGAVALMIWLGLWQLDRLDARREFNDIVTERIEEPPVPAADLLADGGAAPGGDGTAVAVDPEEVEWRQVTATGTYLADQVLWFNRSQNGVAGDNVLTALVTDDGTTLVVNRGFVALSADVPAPPDGRVDVLARVRLPQERRTGELTDDSDGPVAEVRRIDLDQLAAQLPGTVPPIYLDLIDSRPEIIAADPLPVPAPTLDDGPHLSYAVQWFIFAGCVLVGWVLALRRSITTNRQRLAGATGTPTS